MKKFYKLTLNYTRKIRYLILIIFISILPLMTFKIGGENTLFPAFEIIFLYYFLTYYKIPYWQIFLFGIFYDQLFSLPLGLSSLSFILTAMLIEYASKYMNLQDYTTNFIIFLPFSLYIFIFRYIIFILKVNEKPIITEVIFQYFITIFAYPIIRIFLDLRNAR